MQSLLMDSLDLCFFGSEHTVFFLKDELNTNTIKSGNLTEIQISVFLDKANYWQLWAHSFLKSGLAGAEFSCPT